MLLPNHNLASNLAADFFFNKIAKIHKQLTWQSSTYTTVMPAKSSLCSHCPFIDFKQISGSDILKLIKNSPIKSCPLNPLPAKIFKLGIPNLLPVVVNIINLSLTGSTVPTSFNEA